jgi:hypothetical protein
LITSIVSQYVHGLPRILSPPRTESGRQLLAKSTAVKTAMDEIRIPEAR